MDGFRARAMQAGTNLYGYLDAYYTDIPYTLKRVYAGPKKEG